MQIKGARERPRGGAPQPRSGVPGGEQRLGGGLLHLQGEALPEEGHQGIVPGVGRTAQGDARPAASATACRGRTTAACRRRHSPRHSFNRGKCPSAVDDAQRGSHIMHMATEGRGSRPVNQNQIVAGIIEHPLYRALSRTLLFQRLAQISFLGSIDRLRGGRLHSTLLAGTRLDHSVRVAQLVLESTRSMPEEEQLTALAVALLHDIGHGPLSHSSEPFFQEEYDLNHRTQGELFIRSDPHILDVLHTFSVDSARVCSLCFEHADDGLSYLFSYPINVDTIDGIINSASFFGVQLPTDRFRDALLSVLIDPDPSKEWVSDEFWRLKSLVYSYIDSDPALALDKWTTVLFRGGYTPRDVFSDTDQYVFSRFSFIERTIAGAHLQLSTKFARRSRVYTINDSVRLTSHDAMRRRYVVKRITDDAGGIPSYTAGTSIRRSKAGGA